MADNYGVSFAPTNENSAQGPMNGQIDGLPAAIKILALRFPKFFGAQTPAPPELLTAEGAGGIDPIASAVLATMARTVERHSTGGAMSGSGGSKPPTFGLPGGTGGSSQQPDGDLSHTFGPPKIVYQDDPPPPPRKTPFGGDSGTRVPRKFQI